jgi:hypothetical protein
MIFNPQAINITSLTGLTLLIFCAKPVEPVEAESGGNGAAERKLLLRQL